MKKGVTMREIGAALGVSTVTISKALSGKDGVSDAVREKIIKTAEQMGYHYVPPAGAAEEAGRQDEIVGILTPDRFFSSASFYASLYKELLRQMVEVGMLGVLEIVTDEQEAGLSAPVIVAGWRVSALILMGQFEQSYVEMIMEAGLPTVLLDFYCDGPDADAIVSDSLSGCYQLTRRLIERGHREIGFVGSVQCTTSIMERYSGYMRAMIFEGLPMRRCGGFKTASRTARRGRCAPSSGAGSWSANPRGHCTKRKTEQIMPEAVRTLVLTAFLYN